MLIAREVAMASRVGVEVLNKFLSLNEKDALYSRSLNYMASRLCLLGFFCRWQSLLEVEISFAVTRGLLQQAPTGLQLTTLGKVFVSCWWCFLC